ncbi:MAG: hypothetical protein ACR2IK_14365 [Chloroflexota bacterium]
MARVRPWLLGPAILALAVLQAACGGGGGAQATSQPALPSPASAVAPPIISPVVSLSPESSPNAEMQTAVDAALRDAAGRLNLPSDSGDIKLQHVEARQWPDTSLGCPLDGVMYLQTVTPGYVVVVSAAGNQLEYHADSRGRIVLCHEA